MDPKPPDSYLYLAQEDLYRLGNSTGPRLDHVRVNDVQLYEKGGLQYVQANGRGISLLTEARAAKTPGWLWKIPKATAMPVGLALNPDSPGHVSLCPVTDMPLDRFRALLGELSQRCQKVRKQ